MDNDDILPIPKKKTKKRELSPKPAHDTHVKAEVNTGDTTVLRAATELADPDAAVPDNTVKHDATAQLTTMHTDDDTYRRYIERLAALSTPASPSRQQA